MTRCSWTRSATPPDRDPARVVRPTRRARAPTERMARRSACARGSAGRVDGRAAERVPAVAARFEQRPQLRSSPAGLEHVTRPRLLDQRQRRGRAERPLARIVEQPAGVVAAAGAHCGVQTKCPT